MVKHPGEVAFSSSPTPDLFTREQNKIENIIMKRTKSLTEAGKWISTAYNVSKYIPGCEHLYDYHCDWSIWDDDSLIPEIKKDIRLSLNTWLMEESDPEVIAQTLLPLKINTKLRPVLQTIKELVRPSFRWFFESDYKGLPAVLASPIPFFPLSRRADKLIQLDKTIVKRYGLTTMEIGGTVMRTEDLKTTLALIEIMRHSKLQFTQKNIQFRTTREEIAKVMLNSNPSSESTRDAIWNSLKRIRGCVINITNTKGLQTLGGILDGAEELGEDSSYMIDIYLDKTFIKLLQLGYVGVSLKELKPLNPKGTNLYLYLMRQKAFNSGMLFKAGSIFKIYNVASLGGLIERSKAYIRRDIKATLEHLKDQKLLTYTIEDDKLLTRKLKSTVPAEPPGKTIEQLQEDHDKKFKEKVVRGECPFDHRFGIDCEETDDCDGCELWDKCINASVKA